MNKRAQVDSMIADALHRAQAQMSMLPPTANPMGDLISKTLGIRNPMGDGVAKGYGETVGKVMAAGEVGSPKWQMLGYHLPTMALAGGGALLVKTLYDRWKRKQVSEQLDNDADLAHIDPKKRRDALELLGSYAPSLAKDPKASKALIKQMAAYDSITTQDLNTLMEAQKRYQDSIGSGSYFAPIQGTINTLLG